MIEKTGKPPMKKAAQLKLRMSGYFTFALAFISRAVRRAVARRYRM